MAANRTLLLWCSAALLWGGLLNSSAQQYDYGDAPDPTYPALLASHGARHTNITRAWFGASVSAEPDSRQVNADTFDDGLISTWPLTFVVTNNDWTGSLYFNLLADLNGDGDWDDPDEWLERNMEVNVPTGQSRVFRTNLFIAPTLQFYNDQYWRYWRSYNAIRASDGSGEVQVRQSVGLNTLCGSLYGPGSLPHGTVVIPSMTLGGGCRLLDPCFPDQQEIWVYVAPSPHISPGHSARGFVKLSELSGPPLAALINAGIVPMSSDGTIAGPTPYRSSSFTEYVFPPCDFKLLWDSAFPGTAGQYAIPGVQDNVSNTSVVLGSHGTYVYVGGIYGEFAGYVRADDVELLPGSQWGRVVLRRGYLRMTLTGEPLSDYTGTGAFSIGETEDYALPRPRLDRGEDDRPPSIEQGQTLWMNILGEGLMDGSEISFAPSTGIRTEVVMYKSPWMIKALASIDTSAPVGSRDIIVTNPDGQWATLTNAFVVTLKPSRPPVLAIERTAADEIVLWWNGGGFLQQAEQVSGPWVDISDATSPWTNWLTGTPPAFYRVRQGPHPGTGTITGTLTDPYGGPLGGISVRVRGTDNETSPGGRFGIFTLTNVMAGICFFDVFLPIEFFDPCSGKTIRAELTLPVTVPVRADDSTFVSLQVQIVCCPQPPACTSRPWCGIVGGFVDRVWKVVAGGGVHCPGNATITITPPGAARIERTAARHRQTFDPAAGGTWTVTVRACGETQTCSIWLPVPGTGP